MLQAHEVGGLPSKVEKLDFFNHTECECRDASEESDDVTADPTTDLSFKPTRQFSSPQTVKR